MYKNFIALLCLFLISASGCTSISNTQSPQNETYELGNGLSVEITPPAFKKVRESVIIYDILNELLMLGPEYEWIEGNHPERAVRNGERYAFDYEMWSPSIEMKPPSVNGVADHYDISVTPIQYGPSGAIISKPKFKKKNYYKTTRASEDIKPFPISSARVNVPFEPREGFTLVVKTPARTIENPHRKHGSFTYEVERTIVTKPRQFIVKDIDNKTLQTFDNFEDFIESLE